MDSWTGEQPSRKAATYAGQHKHRRNAGRHPCLEWDSNPLSQCSRGRKHFMLETTRPLWSPGTYQWVHILETQNFLFLQFCSHLLRFCIFVGVWKSQTEWLVIRGYCYKPDWVFSGSLGPLTTVYFPWPTANHTNSQKSVLYIFQFFFCMLF
jgi:hypothetical protein